MNDLESQLHYPLGDTLPAIGTTLEVADGVRWLRMDLPFQLNHINLWLLRDELDGVQGWSIVDCGITNDATRAAWEQIFANELGGLPVLRVIVTHMHPDHMGLAHWLTERWNVRLWISATDFNTARLASTSTQGFGGERTAVFMASHGLTDPESQAKIRARTNYYASMVPRVPENFRRLLSGDVLRIGGRDWVCHAGYGHAPEHMSLHCEGLGVLISGDMVLPRISTNVSVHEIEPEANPLVLYLDSIRRMKALPAGTLVLPSHGRPFTGLHTRVDQLVAHHDERFAEVLAACAEAPQCAADLLMVLFKRKLDLHQTTFAIGESIATCTRCGWPAGCRVAWTHKASTASHWPRPLSTTPASARESVPAMKPACRPRAMITSTPPAASTPRRTASTRAAAARVARCSAAAAARRRARSRRSSSCSSATRARSTPCTTARCA